MIAPNQIRLLKRTGGFYHWEGEPGDAAVRRRAGNYAARRITAPETRYGFAREPGAPVGDAIPTVTIQGIVRVA